ncbi:Shufflon protein B, partial [Salmonella enterica subsp. enterica serovar Oranienburg]|nr:Shufflon protein B [Salmonella enterica subsp. enterica serovar Oranienburg]MLV00350.1 Shufflon protein B [Salmonella enterica subsp. enterica serovar Oranienburg]
YIGSFQYSYSAVNRSDKAIMVYASGGTSILNKKVKDGDNCSNTWALAGQVNGSSVTEAGSANSNWSKSGSISFLVPSGSTWTVISDPLPSYGCSPGSFSVSVFTLS